MLAKNVRRDLGAKSELRLALEILLDEGGSHTVR
jgi:hypothetical protein